MINTVAASSERGVALETRKLANFFFVWEACADIERPPTTSPYSQSVDMWSLGAVLFHILSGVPPYTGRAEDRGVQMLRTIMTSDADFEPLRKAGVSESGIDFVAQLLNRDPFSRPTEKECFQHPWIAEVPDVDEYEDDADLLSDHQDGLSIIGEDAEDELDASQLSIADGPGYHHEADGEEGRSSDAISKRPRIEYIPTDVRYPSLPNIESFQDGQAVVDKHAKRLFGEVSASALRSSHALGNLDAYDSNNFPIDFLSSGESMTSDDPNDSIISLPAVPFGGTAPSLMGAEKLVGELNMDSLHPTLQLKGGPVNRSSLRQTTPGHIKDAMPPSTLHKDSVPPTSSPKEEPVSSPQEPTPKVKFTRRIDLALAIPDTASEASSDNSAHNSRRDTAPNIPSRPSKSEYDLEFATTLDAQTGQVILDQLRADETESSEPIVHRPNPPIPSTLSDPEFAKPPKRYGKLKSLPGSIFDLTIYLEDRLTSWGRGPSATVKHADSMDTRIPAYALEVTFWTPGIEARIATGESWLDIPGVMAILSTKARLGIWVNDTLLRRGSMTEDGPEALQFGKLYTGDIITVYQNKDRTKFLKLQCDFTHGESAQPRPGHEAGFMVRQALMTKADRAANRMPIRPQCK
jgi:serine/threonine protein kinase